MNHVAYVVHTGFDVGRLSAALRDSPAAAAGSYCGSAYEPGEVDLLLFPSATQQLFYWTFIINVAEPVVVPTGKVRI